MKHAGPEETVNGPHSFHEYCDYEELEPPLLINPLSDSSNNFFIYFLQTNKRIAI
jgi:hypothetical protein